MKKLTFNKWMLGAVLSVTTLFANAALYNTNITGADMSGLQVTVTFQNNTTESLLWGNIQTVLGTTADNIENHEGFSGSVIGNGWGLSQAGYTGGNVKSPTEYFGLWSFYDKTDSVKSIMLDVVGTGLVFDTDYLAATGVDTNGSAQGRPFTAFNDDKSQFLGATASYSGQVLEELYSQVSIDVELGTTDFTFFLDTDKEITAVPEPSTLVILLAGLVFLTRRKFIK